ncbi:MAG: hypothetical protein ABIP79_13935 [Chitinophagaceae bacterium]
MKKLIKITTCILSVTIIVFVACKKEVNQPIPKINKLPIAKAGADDSIKITPTTTMVYFELNGSNSTDPDNNIVSYKWVAISGPTGYTIKTPNSINTLIENASYGNYEFELTVTDAGGLWSKDSVIITVTNTTALYDVDITLNTTYKFYNNVFDPFQYSIILSDFDLTEITGKVNIMPFGEFDIYVQEFADTASLSDKLYADYIQMSMGQVNPLYIFGLSSINLKKLIRDGGGSFSGTLTITDGSASRSRPTIFSTLPPLIVTGTLDVITHLVSLKIKGKTYF